MIDDICMNYNCNEMIEDTIMDGSCNDMIEDTDWNYTCNAMFKGSSVNYTRIGLIDDKLDLHVHWGSQPSQHKWRGLSC